MSIFRTESLPITSSEDVVRVRQRVRAVAIELGFSLVDQTKVVTATSELARNMMDYAGGGTILVECLNENARKGLRLTFTDHGPGIPNLEQALTDGYSSSGGLGLGLSGARRLSNDFKIESRVGEGTCVQITRWKL